MNPHWNILHTPAIRIYKRRLIRTVNDTRLRSNITVLHKIFMITVIDAIGPHAKVPHVGWEVSFSNVVARESFFFCWRHLYFGAGTVASALGFDRHTVVDDI